VVAAFQMAGDLGAVLGPVAGGFFIDHGGYATALSVSAAVTLAPVLLVRIAPETLARNLPAARVSADQE
jgi:predicted MFS family arabinose efflux permease